MKLIIKILASAAMAAATMTVQAVPIVLDFEGINSSYPTSNYANVQDFYNGGTSSAGTSGTNYGIGFSPNALAICLNTVGSTCSNTSRGGLGNPASQLGGLFFLSGSQTFMNVPAGFDTGFSFFYVALSQAGSVSVYDGLSGTGNLLATLALPTNAGSCPGYNAGFCPFSPTGIGFSGTAQSVSFAGVANQIVFDDITFGSITPDPDPPQQIPEPSTLLLFGAAILSLGMKKLRG